MLRTTSILAVILLTSCGHAPTAAPDPGEPPVVDEAVAGPQCAPRLTEVADPNSASETLHVWAELLAQEVGEALERTLCVVSLEDVRSGDRSLRGELAILDRDSEELRTFDISTGFVPSQTRPAWRPRDLPGRIAGSFAIRHADEWLAEHADLLSATRREINQGLHLLRFQRADGTELCLQWRHDRGAGKTWCWDDARAVTRAEDSEFEYTDGDLEEEFAGFLALEIDDGTTDALAVRFPTPERAPAPGLQLPPQRERLPSWFPSLDNAPYRRIPTTGWTTLDAAESEHLGPLSFIEVSVLGDGILRLATKDEHRLCARLERWACTDSQPRRDGDRIRTWVDAFQIDESRIAGVSASLSSDASTPQVNLGGRLSLGLFVHEAHRLEAQGAVTVGGVSWTADAADPTRIQVERSFHRVRAESGCLRFEPATTDAGVTDRGFRALSSRRTRPMLSPAAGEVSLHEAPSEVHDLGGLWELGEQSLRRTLRCESSLGSFVECTGRLPEVPETLPSEAAACLARAIEVARALPGALEGIGPQPCGAHETHRGQEVGRYRYQYQDGLRLRQEYENLALTRDGVRTLEVTRLIYRGGFVSQRITESTEYLNGEPDCVNEHAVTFTLNSSGQPTHARHVSDTCEGVDSGTRRERILISTGDGFDRVQIQENGSAVDQRERFDLPDVIAPQATVSCREGTACSCSVELRDCQGNPMARVSHSGESRVLTYEHQCE